MPTYDLPSSFDFDDPRVQKTIAAITAKNIRVTAAHVSQSRTLHFIAEWYASRYNGRFDYMRQMRDLILSDRDLSVNQMAGVINCLVHDASKCKPTIDQHMANAVQPVDLSDGPVYDGDDMLQECAYCHRMSRCTPTLNQDMTHTINVCETPDSFCHAQRSKRSKLEELPADLPAVESPPIAPRFTTDAYLVALNESERQSGIDRGSETITPIVKNGTYTVVLNERGDYRTLKIEDCPDVLKRAPGMQIASYLSGSDNERDFTGCAFIAGDQVMMWARFKADSISAQALKILVGATEDRRADYGTAYAIESGRCCRCGRKLTVPASLHRGMGPDCASK